MVVLLDDEDLTFNDGQSSSGKQAELAAKIAVGVSFEASTITLDNLFEATGRNRDPASDDEFYLLWTLVYAVRNAFAHGIANPRWIIKDKYQRELKISIAGRDTTINLAGLNGQDFNYVRIGGAAKWFQIKDCVLALVSS